MSARAQTENLASNGENVNQLHRALGCAIALHLLLAWLLPDLPRLAIPAIDRGKGITVFLRSTPEPEQFDQNLNAPGQLSDNQLDNLQPVAGLPASQTGQDEALTDAAPKVESDKQDQIESNPAGSEDKAGISPSVFITRSMIRVFAQEEAFMQAERDPEALQRFSRSFRSYATYRQRPRTEDFRDIYGDYYVRSSAANGDICFMQQKDQQPDEFSTNTVYFFRCGKEPLSLNLSDTP